jgi:hypothetical protein
MGKQGILLHLRKFIPSQHEKYWLGALGAELSEQGCKIKFWFFKRSRLSKKRFLKAGIFKKKFF